MQHLADLLATIPMPELPEAGGTSLTRLPSGSLAQPWSDPDDPASLDSMGPSKLGCDADLVQDLAADLPAGHLHVWGGPSGVGKTSFLLSLLHAAAARGRRVAYATYDLAPESLALRMLAMAAGVDLHALPDPGGSTSQCSLDEAGLRRAHGARAALSRLPFSFVAARGFSVDSIQDRLVRMPFRAEVLAIDYLQGVIREPGSDMGVTLRGLSDLAEHLHVAIVCAARPEGTRARDVETPSALVDASTAPHQKAPDRIGWLGTMPAPGGPAPGGPAPGGPTQGVSGSEVSGADVSGSVGAPSDEISRAQDPLPLLRKAEVMHNRHGERTSMPLAFDEASGVIERAVVEEAKPSAE